jgi:hypothetical protein
VPLMRRWTADGRRCNNRLHKTPYKSEGHRESGLAAGQGIQPLNCVRSAPVPPSIPEQGWSGGLGIGRRLRADPGRPEIQNHCRYGAADGRHGVTVIVRPSGHGAGPPRAPRNGVVYGRGTAERFVTVGSYNF